MFRSNISLQSLRVIALAGATAGLMAIAPAANAMPATGDPSSSETVKSTPVALGDTKYDLKANTGTSAVTGDTKSDLPSSVSSPVSFAVGDTKFDAPGATRAPQAPATFVTVERPRTVIDDGDPVLPIVLSGLALLVAVGGVGYSVSRRPAMQPRPSH